MNRKAEQERSARVNAGFESLLERQRVTTTIICPICHTPIEFTVIMKQLHWNSGEMEIDVPVGQGHVCPTIVKTRDHAHSTMYTDLERYFNELDDNAPFVRSSKP